MTLVLAFFCELQLIEKNEDSSRITIDLNGATVNYEFNPT